MRSVAHLVNISSIDLFFNRDAAGCCDTGPRLPKAEVEAVVVAVVGAAEAVGAVVEAVLNRPKPPVDADVVAIGAVEAVAVD